MNNSTLIFLINKKARAVACVYDPEAYAAKKETPTVFKTLDPAVTVGDYVVIPTGTRHNMTVVQVVSTTIEIDLDSSVEVKWIVSRVDRTNLERLEAMEADLVSRVHNAEKEKRREALRDTLLQAAGDGIKALPIYDESGATTEAQG